MTNRTLVLLAALVALAASTKKDDSLAYAFAPFVWAIGAIPAGVGGGLVGGTLTRLDDGWHPVLRFTPSARNAR